MKIDIKQLRQTLGFSVVEVAEAADRNKSALYQYERSGKGTRTKPGRRWVKTLVLMAAACQETRDLLRDASSSTISGLAQGLIDTGHGTVSSVVCDDGIAFIV